MLVKIKVSGYITLDIPTDILIDANTKQDWINEFGNWITTSQLELSAPAFDDVETWIEDIDFLVTDD